MTKCKLDTIQCPDCSKYATDDCTPCFKHSFKKIQCESSSRDCNKCQYLLKK